MSSVWCVEAHLSTDHVFQAFRSSSRHLQVEGDLSADHICQLVDLTGLIPQADL